MECFCHGFAYSGNCSVNPVALLSDAVLLYGFMRRILFPSCIPKGKDDGNICTNPVPKLRMNTNHKYVRIALSNKFFLWRDPIPFPSSLIDTTLEVTPIKLFKHVASLWIYQKRWPHHIQMQLGGIPGHLLCCYINGSNLSAFTLSFLSYFTTYVRLCCHRSWDSQLLRS